MHPPFRRFALALVVTLSLLLLPMCGQRKNDSAKPAAPALDKPALAAYVRHLLAWPETVTVEIGDPAPSEIPGLREIVVTGTLEGRSAQQKFLITADGQKLIQGTIFDLKQNPFRPELAKLTTDSQPSLGTPGAPVVLVLFTDFECPYCREESKTLRANLLTTYPKEVRLYLKDYPLSQIHPWAKPAAIAGRCIFQQSPEAFWMYHDWIFDQQAQISAANLNSKVMEFAVGKPLDPLHLKRCLDTRATEAEVDKELKEGESLQVDSTPTLFVNGRRINQTMAWPQLKSLIDSELAYQKTAKNAGDQACCEVKLPSAPAKK